MNPFIWCAVGAVTGWIASLVMPATGAVSRIENVLVAVFGAFIGGEFLASLLGAGAAGEGLRPASLGLSVVGAAGLLVLLGLMRRAVGPLRPHKLRRKSRP